MQRLAGLEEVLPIPDINQFIASSVSKDIQNSIQASLLKVEFCLGHFLSFFGCFKLNLIYPGYALC